MTQTELKPWSATDDWHETDESDGCRAESGPMQSLATHRSYVDRIKTHLRWGRGALVVASTLVPAVLWLSVSFLRASGSVATIARWQIACILVFLCIGVAGAVLTALADRSTLASLFQELSPSCAPRTRLTGDSVFPHELVPIVENIRGECARLAKEADELIAEKRRVELEYRLSEQQRYQFDAILDALPEVVITVDPSGELIHVNSAARGLLQMTPDQAMARCSLSELLTDADLDSAITHARAAASHIGPNQFEHLMGENRYSVTLVRCDSTNGERSARSTIDGHVVILRDITKEAEISKAKSEFVSRVAHELRTPLSSIKAYIEMLADNEVADEKARREYYEIIESCADRLGRLVENMLNISRIESGTVRVTKEPLSLAPLVKEVVDVLRPQAEAKLLALDVDLTPVFYQVLADRDMMSQVFLNVIGNAIKYTPEEGRIHVQMSVSEESRAVSVAITDTGVGIPADDRERIFEKFYRVAQNSKMGPGTGLGLNLARQIVATVHGGSVGVTSEIGKGSCFTITMPLHS